MSDFFNQVAGELERGRDLVLAAIVRQVGSAPRSIGTRFYVAHDGKGVGTIGGGRLEAEVIEAAKKALVKRRAFLLPFRLKGVDVAETDMLCGGDVDVFLEPVFAADSAALPLFKRAARLAREGQRGLMITALSGGPAESLAGRKVLYLPDGGRVGHLEGIAAPDSLAGEMPARPVLAEATGAQLFLEPICRRPVVYLLGGGHISLHLAPLVKMAGFDLVLGEDRPEYASRDRFPAADRILLKEFDNMLAGEELGPEAYVVIITRGHIHDKTVLAQALNKTTAYTGMIGSRRKRGIIYKALEEEGYSPEAIGQVHSPIGLDIGAETPEEIAIAIVGELIQVRASQEGRACKKMPLGV